MARRRAATVSRTATRGAAALMLAASIAACASTSVLVAHPATRSDVMVGAGVPTAVVSVIRGWADALRHGHVAAAARFFHVPSIFFTGNGPAIELASAGEVREANASLPCGAKLIAVARRGRYVNALFRLTNRAGPGGQDGCGPGIGETARTDFLIRHGLIIEWLRAPDEPGDNGSPPPGASPGQTSGSSLI